MRLNSTLIHTPIVALTGGIGSGKSEAAKQFEKLGVPVVDTDVIAHELTAPGMPILKEINRIFNGNFLMHDGTLDRTKLRAYVFNNNTERLKLEALIHPAIYQRTITKLIENEKSSPPIYQVIVVPLLFESNRYSGLAHTKLVIDCDENLQIQRAMARSKLTESEVTSMMRAQISRTVRLSLADDVIENNGSLTELKEKINEFHKKFIKTCIVSK
ncbi:dephospho-CoA kinase [mine drainage metagenome]|uniref:Dephospho-CoA kinase n=1 Tax=mine drainage metagenome TaxID=410659 RepID=A0A1J5RUC9_9ZZZZ